MSCLLLVTVTVIVAAVDSAPKYRRLQNKDSILDTQSIEEFKTIADDASYSDDYLSNDSIGINLRSLNETTIPAAFNDSLAINISNLNETTVAAGINDSIGIKESVSVTTVSAGSDDSIGINLRNFNETAIPAGADGYIFDENICKEVNERILCGYDKNNEEYTEATIDDLGSGCSLHGGRIECGYKVKQLSNTNIESPNLRENKEPSIETLTVDEKYGDEYSTDKKQASISENTGSSPLSSIVTTTLSIDMRALHIDVSSEEIKSTPDHIQTSTSEGTDSFTSSIAFSSISTVETKPSNHEINSERDATSPKQGTNGTDTFISPITVSKTSTVKINLEKVATTPNQMQSMDLESTTPQTNTVLSSTSLTASNSTTENFEVTAGIPELTFIESQNEDEMIPEIVYLNGTEEDMAHQRPKRHTSVEILGTTPIDGFTSKQHFLPSKLKLTKEEASKVKTVCVEQDDRIVCYDLLEE